MLQALGLAIRSYSNGKPDAAPQVTLSSREYAAILTGHFEKEDTLLFRLVDEVLPDDVHAMLATAFQRAEEELGAGGRGRYEDIARDLERNWAI